MKVSFKRNHSIVLVCDWVVVVFIFVGIVSLVISAILKLPTCARESALKLRRLLLLPFPGSLEVVSRNHARAI